MPFTRSADSTRIHYTDAGGIGTPVLLIHGFGSGLRLWDGQADALRGAGYRMIAYDMRGHAQSESPSDSSRYSKLAQVEDMRAVLDACAVRSALVVAHSMGGMDSLLFFLKYPSYVRGFVLYGTGPGFASDKGRLRWNAQAATLAEGYETRGLDALRGSDRRKGHTTATGLINAARGNYTQRDDDPLFVELRALGGPLAVARNLDKISVPCAVIVGERDKAFFGASQMMARKLPDATLDVIAGAGHMACEKNTRDFNAVLLSTLARLNSAGTSVAARL